VQAARLFASNTNGWLTEMSAEAKKISTALDDYCGRVQCDSAVSSAILSMQSLETTTQSIVDAFAYHGTQLCPSTGCINLGLLWFVKQTGCMCNAQTINYVKSAAHSGMRCFLSECRKPCRPCTPGCAQVASCRIHPDVHQCWVRNAGRVKSLTGAASLGVALIAALLLVAKVAMNIKSLVKDDHWMRRVRMLFGKLSARGHNIPLRRADSAIESLYGGASMSQYPGTRRHTFEHSAPLGGGDSSGLVAAGSYITKPLKEVSYEGPHSDDGNFLDGDVTFLPPPPQALPSCNSDISLMPPPRPPVKMPRV
jgi:hypothetical protein